MTDQEYVLSLCPKATCFKSKLFWPGSKVRECYIVTFAQHLSNVEGSGDTEEMAWKRTAQRLHARQEKRMTDLEKRRPEIQKWCEENLFGPREVPGVGRIPLSKEQEAVCLMAVEIIVKWEGANKPLPTYQGPL